MLLLFLPWREAVFGFLVPELSFPSCAHCQGGGGNVLPKAEHVRGEPSPVLQDLQMTQMVKLGTYHSIVQESRKLSTHQQISMQEHPEMRQLNLSSLTPPFLS